MNYALMQGDCLEALKLLPDDSIDSLVTDPPAGISFMGKSWDGDKGGRVEWISWLTQVMSECFRVMKPGAHGLVWALPRTSHWTATACDDAGFEIRDVVTHLFGTGFPKSMNISIAIDKQAGAMKARGKAFVSAGAGERKDLQGTTGAEAFERHEGITDSAKQWQGWGTALKPASEHWILIRKPCSEKTVAANVLKWGTGALNIDGSRIGLGDGEKNPSIARYNSMPQKGANGWEHANRGGNFDETTAASMSLGRFPANLILDEEAARLLDEQSGVSPSNVRQNKKGSQSNGVTGWLGSDVNPPNDSGGASRFFYVAKASKSDKGADNTHPTVKSSKLMSYLIKMITPPQGVVLDPFMGSGSTGVAALAGNFVFIGIEREDEYCKIAEARLSAATGEIALPVTLEEQLSIEQEESA